MTSSQKTEWGTTHTHIY